MASVIKTGRLEPQKGPWVNIKVIYFIFYALSAPQTQIQLVPHGSTLKLITQNCPHSVNKPSYLLLTKE